MKKKQHPDRSQERTLAMIAAGGIGSFLLVLVFPKGAKYFFKNWFAGLVRDIVIVSIAGLATQKFAEIFSRYADPAQRSPR